MKKSGLNLALIILITAIIGLGITLCLSAYFTFGDTFFQGRWPGSEAHREYMEKTRSENGEDTETFFQEHGFMRNKHYSASHFSPVRIILFFALIGIIIVFIVRKRAYHRDFHPSALDILREKYATGEITAEEYEERKKTLKEK